MEKILDFKKENKELYSQKKEPFFVKVPTMKFIIVEGRGNPNTCAEYKNAMEVLYGLSYAIKMSKNKPIQPEGYYDYVIPPLEGLWDVEDEDFDFHTITNKDKFHWFAMLRQPDFVTDLVFEQAKMEVLKKKPLLNFSTTTLEDRTEGNCAQIFHLGSYDDEPKTISILHKFILDSGYQVDITNIRKHHEIYLNNPNKTPVDKLKTIIRYPIK